MRGVKQRFHLRPLGLVALPHLIPQPSQRAELHYERQLIFAVHIVEAARLTGLLQRGRKLVRMHVARLDLVLLKELDLCKRFERADGGRQGGVVGMILFGAALGIRQKIQGESGLDLRGIHDELFQES